MPHLNDNRLGAALRWAKANKRDRCHICGKPQSDEGRLLAKDHSHATGNHRGYLCFQCNAGIGMFKDNPTLLFAAAEYLLGSTPACEEISIVARFRANLISVK